MMGWALATALALSTPTGDLVPPESAQIMAVPPELKALVQQRVNAPAPTSCSDCAG